jgi:hypothetical protein
MRFSRENVNLILQTTVQIEIEGWPVLYDMSVTENISTIDPQVFNNLRTQNYFLQADNIYDTQQSSMPRVSQRIRILLV